MAVSGLHVGAVFLFTNFFLGLIFVRKIKQWRYLPLLFVLWTYAFITGLAPSVVRATTMFSFMIVGMAIGRKGITYNTIAISALLMLIYNPLYITDIGFQLSYAAVFFIILLQKRISSLLTIKNIFLKKTWDLTAVSIAAQIGTLPITLYYFHQLPLLSCVISIFIVPASSAVIYLSFLMIITAPISILSNALAFALNLMLKAMNFAVNTFENIPHSTIQNIAFEGIDLVLLLTLTGSVCLYVTFRKYKALMIGLACILGIVLCNSYRYYCTAKQCILAVHNVHGTSVVNVIEGFHNTVISYDDYSKARYKIKSLQNKFKTNEPKYTTKNFMEVNGKRLYLLNYKISNAIAKEPLMTDFLIIGRKTDIPSDDINKLFKFKKVIIDSSNSKKQVKKWKLYFEKYKITPYSVSDNGAFFSRI